MIARICLIVELSKQIAARMIVFQPARGNKDADTLKGHPISHPRGSISSPVARVTRQGQGTHSIIGIVHSRKRIPSGRLFQGIIEANAIRFE